ncbi:M48 family metallopeptidase [Roseospirillum parvum]|uniref:Peptidase family M48 n=1 Tax=Roseospirillum parvum TaxID=83401 RepID=A0A1G8AVQ5_9PROT|nr:M48 family metallopeptidase [Roseospirillum parvum]SDH25049.1 Peptidase family M48 [Roseospirillum parvum]
MMPASGPPRPPQPEPSRQPLDDAPQAAFHMARWVRSASPGETPVPVALMIDPRAGQLLLLDVEGRALDRWSLPRLALPGGRPPPGGSLTLTSAERPGQRLHTLDDSLLAPLWLYARHVFTPASNRKPWFWLAGVGGGLAALLALALLVATVFLPWAGHQVADYVPAEWERAWGETMAGELGTTCRSRRGHAALARLTSRIAGDLDLRHPITVRVIDDPTVNALALPGGQIVLFRGLLEAAPEGTSGADQVAGVLAHEIGHLRHGHVTQMLVSRSLVGVVIGLATGGDPGMISQGAGWLLEQSYSRQAEREADATALDLLTRAAIDPAGLAAFLETVAENETVTLPAFLSSHPDSLKRAQAIRAHPAPPASGPALPAGEWADLRAICQ